MTNIEINQALVPVYQALNNISVSGRDNLGNLAGAIRVIEDILNKTAEAVKQESAE